MSSSDVGTIYGILILMRGNMMKMKPSCINLISGSFLFLFLFFFRVVIYFYTLIVVIILKV